MKKEKGFTIIEILVIVAILSILITVILTFMGQARKNARINSAKTTLKSVVTTIVSCKDPSGSGMVNAPLPIEDGTKQICNNIPNAFWPELPGGYTYEAVGANYSINCQFEVNTNGDTPNNLKCNCVSQLCTY